MAHVRRAEYEDREDCEVVWSMRRGGEGVVCIPVGPAWDGMPGWARHARTAYRIGHSTMYAKYHSVRHAYKAAGDGSE